MKRPVRGKKTRHGARNEDTEGEEVCQCELTMHLHQIVSRRRLLYPARPKLSCVFPDNLSLRKMFGVRPRPKWCAPAVVVLPLLMSNLFENQKNSAYQISSARQFSPIDNNMKLLGVYVCGNLRNFEKSCEMIYTWGRSREMETRDLRREQPTPR